MLQSYLPRDRFVPLLGALLDNHTDQQIQQYNDAAYVPHEDTISLLDLIGVLVKRWRLLLFTTLFAALFIVLFSIYTVKLPPDSKANPMPNVYSPNVLVLLQTTSSSNTLSQLLSGTSSTLSSLGSSLGSAGTSADLAQALLKENTILDQVVKDFDLIKKLHITKNPLDSSRKYVSSHLTVKYTATTGILDISFTSTDPVFATKVVNRIVDLLEARFHALTMEKVLNKKAFLEGRVAQVGKDLKASENSLIDFQTKYGIVDMSATTANTATQLGSYQSQLNALQLQKQNLLMYNKADSAAVVRLDDQIKQLQQFIAQLRGGFRLFSSQSISADAIVRLGVEYQNLVAKLSLQASLYKTMQEQLEAVKLQEQDPTQTFQIIQHAEIPELKSGPSRGKISIIVTVTAFFLAVFSAFIMEYFEKVKQDPIEAQKLDAIRNTLHRKRTQGT